MGYQTIILEKADGIATITLNRPQRRNAFNSQLLDEFINAKKEVAADPEVKVIIITGAGTSFCSGADFASDGMEPKEELPPAMKMRSGIAAQETQMLDLRKIPKPIIAMVNGPAIGAGLGFCLSCDIIIAADDAAFGFGFVKLGLHPEEGITFLLPRIVGMAKACELLFLGKTIDAREAERIAASFPDSYYRESWLKIAQGYRELAGQPERSSDTAKDIHLYPVRLFQFVTGQPSSLAGVFQSGSFDMGPG